MSPYKQAFNKLIADGKIKLRCDPTSIKTMRRELFRLQAEYVGMMQTIDDNFIAPKLQFKREGETNIYIFKLVDREKAAAKFVLIGEEDEDVSPDLGSGKEKQSG